MDVVQGCGVGGGSLHYFNVCKQPPAAIFDQPRWPRTITLDRLRPYYRAAKSALGAAPFSPPSGRQLPLRTQRFVDAVKRRGRDVEYLDIAVRSESHGDQGACIYCGSCLLGCQVKAKNSLDLNYIRVAEQHGARVYPLHKVENIQPDGDGYTVHVVRSPGPTQESAERLTFTAPVVVVSAGTLGSTELLLKCRDVYKSLPRVSRKLGTGFSGNGDFLLAGTLYKNTLIDPGSGPSITAATSFEANGHHICIEDLGFPDLLLWYLNGAIPTRQRMRESFAFAWHYLRRTVGLDHKSLMDLELDRHFKGGITTRFLPYLGMGTDAADGVLTLDSDNCIDVEWNHAASLPMFKEMHRELRAMSAATGGCYVQSFLWRRPFRKLLTAHPIGGCALSAGPDEGVVNEFGEVWNYPNLYVADGSVIPTALSVNPSATISALAERIAFHMIHHRELAESEVTSLSLEPVAAPSDDRILAVH